jgi:hypothetical protein
MAVGDAEPVPHASRSHAIDSGGAEANREGFIRVIEADRRAWRSRSGSVRLQPAGVAPKCRIAAAPAGPWPLCCFWFSPPPRGRRQGRRHSPEERRPPPRARSTSSISTDPLGKASVHWGEITGVTSPRTFDVQLALRVSTTALTAIRRTNRSRTISASASRWVGNSNQAVSVRSKALTGPFCERSRAGSCDSRVSSA